MVGDISPSAESQPALAASSATVGESGSMTRTTLILTVQFALTDMRSFI